MSFRCYSSAVHILLGQPLLVSSTCPVSLFLRTHCIQCWDTFDFLPIKLYLWSSCWICKTFTQACLKLVLSQLSVMCRHNTSSCFESGAFLCSSDSLNSKKIWTWSGIEKAVNVQRKNMPQNLESYCSRPFLKAIRMSGSFRAKYKNKSGGSRLLQSTVIKTIKSESGKFWEKCEWILFRSK